MIRKQEIGIIGLGKFGFQMARTLQGLGHNVMGIEQGEARVRVAQDTIPQVFQADATDLAALQQLRVQDLDMVFVSVGGSMDTSLLITLNLQELGVKRIGVKASSAEHQKVLQRMGVEIAVLPEHEAATLLAHRLTNPGMLDLLPLGGGVLVQEVQVNKWNGMTLAELKLVAEHQVMVLAIKEAGSKEYRFVPQARTRLSTGDMLALIGKPEDILKLEA